MKHTLSGLDEKTLMKMIVRRSTGQVLGIHMVGPDAGEIIQGMAIAIRAGATKVVFDSTIGIIRPLRKSSSPCARLWVDAVGKTNVNDANPASLTFVISE